MKKLFLALLLIIVSLSLFAQVNETPRLDFWDFLRNRDWINVGLVIIFSVGGIAVYANKVRNKIKEIATLLMMIYEFTDDKVLDKDERKKLWKQILKVVGSKLYKKIAPQAKEKAASLKTIDPIYATPQEVKAAAKRKKKIVNK